MAVTGARKRVVLTVLGAIPLALGLVAVRGGPTPVRAWNPSDAPVIQQRLLDSAADIELGLDSPVVKDPPPPRNYQPSGRANQCPVRLDGNIKVNQGCLNLTAPDLQGRGQAHNETAIAVNLGDATQVLASSNDYTLGDGLAGGTAYSSNGGRTWQNSEVPVQFTRGADFGSGFAGNQCSPVANPAPQRMYWQGGGDSSVAWDTQGNAYFADLHFNRGATVSDNPDYSSAVYVHRSTGNGGASWTFPGTPVATCFQPTTPGSGVPLEDKPYMTVDDSADSPYRDRIYVTWTLFAADGTAYLYEAHSADYGRTFSKPVAVNSVSDSASLCANTYKLPTPNGPCNENQFSDPFVGPDGTLYVVYDNYNNAVNPTPTCPVPGSNPPATQPCDNHNQVLLSRSTDGGATFLPAVQVGEFNDLPDCPTYQGGQNPGRSCVPEKGSTQNSVFRATNYPSGQANPNGNGQVAVTYGSYINAYSNPSNGCVPQGFAADGNNLYSGVKTPGACANKILVSVSADNGVTFTGTGVAPTAVPVVNQDPAQAHTDQWWQWSQFSWQGTLAVSSYDRQYDADETNGNMDVTLSASDDLASFAQQRVTSYSMPPPTQFPNAQGHGLFMGDYTGLSIGDNRDAHPLWTDTRDVDLIDCGAPGPPSVCTFTAADGTQANTQDIFTATVGF